MVKDSEGYSTSNVQFNVVNFLPKWQNEYGQGTFEPAS